METVYRHEGEGVGDSRAGSHVLSVACRGVNSVREKRMQLGGEAQEHKTPIEVMGCSKIGH